VDLTLKAAGGWSLKFEKAMPRPGRLGNTETLNKEAGKGGGRKKGNNPLFQLWSNVA